MTAAVLREMAAAAAKRAGDLLHDRCETAVVLVGAFGRGRHF